MIEVSETKKLAMPQLMFAQHTSGLSVNVKRRFCMGVIAVVIWKQLAFQELESNL